MTSEGRKSLRPLWVLLHRWVGLALVPWLVIVALTGAVIPFSDELDAALNPSWFHVPAGGESPMDPIDLHDRVEASVAPRAHVDYVVLSTPPGESVRYFLSPSENPLTGTPFPLGNDQLFVDPYTGAELGARRYDATSLAPANLVNFLNRLHYCLAMPDERLAIAGGYVLGITALLWTMDCFVGAYLSLPRRRGSGAAKRRPRPWLARWRIAWSLKWPASLTRINFDLHRAFGLWTWLLLLVLAWSSVGLNLGEVYRPATRALFGLRADLPPAAQGGAPPRLTWRTALERGRELMADEARRAGFRIEREDTLAIDRSHGAYVYTIWSNLDRARWPMTAVTFDANDGRLLRTDRVGHPEDRLGDVLTRWMIWLHMAAIFGLPMQIAIALAGIVLTALSVTGVVIWWGKRSVRLLHAKASRID